MDRGIAGKDHRASWIFANLGIGLIPLRVMANIEIEIAVIIKIGESRGRRPVSVSAETRGCGAIFKGPVASVAVECVRTPTSDEQVWVAVMIIISHGNTVPVATRHAGDSGLDADILECAVSSITEEPVQRARGRGRWRKCPALNAVDIEPAVAIVIEQADAATGHLGQLMNRRLTVVFHE